MATWQQFAEAEPEMAQALTSQLARVPIVYLATTRRDGAPRVHPVCPIFAAGRMYVAVPAWSPKRFDLKNDGRFALHALPGPRDDEFYATGRAAFANDPTTREAINLAAGHQIHPHDWLFEFELEYVMTAYWENTGQPDTYPVRRHWPNTPTPLP